MNFANPAVQTAARLAYERTVEAGPFHPGKNRFSKQDASPTPVCGEFAIII
jgi:hypothetical protein